jgi:hypothetical protein
MRLVYEEMRDWNYASGREEFKSAQLRLVCKNEQEFYASWEKIKSINGVMWCGCPDIEQNSYSDLVASVQKERHGTIKEVKEDVAYLRQEINRALGIGKR